MAAPVNALFLTAGPRSGDGKIKCATGTEEIRAIADFPSLGDAVSSIIRELLTECLRNHLAIINRAANVYCCP